MALTADAKLYSIDTPELFPKLNFPMCGNALVYGNSIAYTDSNGRIVDPGVAPTTGKVWGLIQRQTSTQALSNPFGSTTALANCALTAEVNQGIFGVPYCSTDGFAEADVGAAAYLYDNITVTKTAGSLIKAGKVVAVAGIGQGVGLPAGYVAVAFGLVGGVI